MLGGIKTHENLLFCGTDVGLVVYNWEHLMEAAQSNSEPHPLFELPLLCSQGHPKVSVFMTISHALLSD